MADIPELIWEMFRLVARTTKLLKVEHRITLDGEVFRFYVDTDSTGVYREITETTLIKEATSEQA